MRSALAWCVAVLATALTFLLSAAALPLSPGGAAGAVLTRWWARAMLLGAGVRMRREGLGHVPRAPCVIVANHSSMLDICVLAAALPLRFHFASRPLFFRIPVLGWAMHLARHARIDPKDPRGARHALDGLGARLRRGLSLCLFPEGTRSPDGRVRRYRRGPFLLAVENGVPVLPVRLDGVFPLLPKGSMRFRPGRVTVTIGAPVATGGQDARELAQRVESWTKEAGGW